MVAVASASPSHHEPTNNYIYDNESFEADDEADFEDLLSASVFEVGSATSVTAAAASSPSPRDWTPSQASSRSQLPSTQVRLRPKLRPTQRTASDAHHKLRLEEQVKASSSKEATRVEALTLSIRGQNCANASAQLDLHARRRYVQVYIYTTICITYIICTCD